MSRLDYLYKLIWVPSLALVISIVYMLLDTSLPGEYTGEATAKIHNNRIMLTYGFKRHRFCDVDIYRQVIHEGQVETLPAVHVTAGQVQKMNQVKPDIVDQVLPLSYGPLVGDITLRVALDYSCNLIQIIKPLRYEYDVVFSLNK